MEKELNDNLMYSRQIPLITQEGQKKLNNSKVFVVGAGGLGSICLYYLAAAGVGTIGIIDDDVVNIHNLNRQIIHNRGDVGKSKAYSAKNKLSMLQEKCDLKVYNCKIEETNINLINDYDIVVDCSDNFDTKYLLNDLCVKFDKPLFFASVVAYEGYVMNIIPKETSCLRCVFPDNPKGTNDKTNVERCDKYGVLGSAVGIIASMQTTEVIKYIIGSKGVMKNTLLYYDAEKVEI